MKRIHIETQSALIYEPENGDKSNVVIFIHGGGEYGNGDDQITLLEKNALFMHANNGVEYPFIILAVQSHSSNYPKELIDKAIVLSTSLYNNASLHITGLSLGGKAVYNAVSYYPQHFKTCGSVAGLCNVTIPVDSSPIIRQWHGDLDTSANKYGTAKYKFNANLDEYQKDHLFITMYGYAHNNWNEVYKDGGMYTQWLSNYLTDNVPPTDSSDDYEKGVSDGKIIGWNECIDSIKLAKK